MSYNQWTLKVIRTGTLFLDPHNPRLPPSTRVLLEREIIAHLVENENVIEIAKSIVVNGYYPHEVLIVVKEGARHYVLEGNRRLAACKLLLNPQLAPEAHEQKFRRLAEEADLRDLGRLRAVIAPSRSAAIPMIISRHTSQQIRGWAPIMKANYYVTLLQEGMTLTELAERIHVPAKEIRSAVQMSEMYSIACKMRLPAETAAKVTNPKMFQMTTIERIYETPTGRDFLGIEFDDNGKVKGKVSKVEFEKAYTKIISDVAAEDPEVHSRTLNTAEQISAYLEKISRYSPDKAKPGTFTADSFKAPIETQRPTPATKPARRRQPLHYRGVIPHTLRCVIGNEIVCDTFDELKKISVAQCPRAAGLLLRSFMELAVSHFMRRNGEIQKMTAELQEEVERKNRLRPDQPQRMPKDWSPTLKEMLDRLAQSQALIPDPKIRRGLNTFVNGDLKFLLNPFAHNETVPATEDRVRTSWKSIEEFTKYIISQE